jgi:Gas vesicle synthesis protein GvpO
MATRSEASAKRQEDRRRRHQTAGPEEDGDARDESQGTAQATKGAIAALLAGAAVAAVRGALAARRDAAEDDDDDEETEVDEQPAEPGAIVEDEAEAEPEQAEDDGDPDEPEQPEASAKPVAAEGGDDDGPPPEGVSTLDLTRIVARAHEQLHALHGHEAESVSSLERTPNGWLVMLEVVELRRVPDSMDVLATYELDLDEDGNVRRYARRRRYHRAQADMHGDE